ncbi:MAG TPA: bifunctional 2-polyprenyl-6-hydroxyphenol methylase/3-demethylubiquinol 3-O-methyltransferase UbiG [Candidatus Acidoferrales bacterium]|nr:bifunctional 2-polyprenyl-6-hydroxyphenol methylase/3-demethylubiquinol 3-O-methyltransferase UbiG [Candidatus Acidoferrales bacterium]
MQPTSEDVYKQIDNSLYNELGDIWWNENRILHLLKTSVNPARAGYFRRILDETLKFEHRGTSALDVGCGGGILAEEFAGIGFRVTGIDPSEESLNTARQHARSAGLAIDYRQGTGESIPFADNTYPVVYCCDVLEHVRDLPRVISEIYRVTKPGGVFFFDTLNRTFASKLVAIKIWQEWKSTAFMPPQLHEWRMFIRPEELKELLLQTGFEFREFRGTSPNVSVLKMISLLRKRAKGKIGMKELGRSFRLVESDDLKVLYMGYAVKPSR